MAPRENDEAINLLSLDGGGVRGVSSLVTLDEIMKKIRDLYGLPEVPKPCDFFHMVAGTSTGGLIAIMLGRLRMSTQEALQEYDNCAAKIFSKENKKTWSLSERFRATALQEAVEDLVKRRGLGERMWDTTAPEKGKAIVCVMPSHDIGKCRVVRTFPGDPGVDEQWDREITIWEAARATTAASTFFKPQKLGSGPTAHTYIDAAIGVNNPVGYLLEQAIEEFGTGRRLGCVVSIGTGTRDVKLGRALSGVRNLIQAPKYFYHLANTLKSTATDAEATHRQLQSKLLLFPGAYFRFNVPEVADKIKLHDYQKMPELKSLTAKYLANAEVATQVREIAEGLQTDGFNHGLTLGLIHAPDREQVVLSTAVGQRMGMSSSFFLGRGDILQRLDSIFCPRDTGGKPLRECLLHGIGGVGKTEIALKISEVLEDRFRYIFFIDGSMPSTIRQSYVQICKEYSLGNGSGEAMQTLAMRWMSELTEEWLMIFDDCNLSDRQGHLPGRSKGNVIYTSRSLDLRCDLLSDCVFEVTPFDEADAIQLLMKASGTSSDLADMDSAKAMVQVLGCLPIAIDKAAAAIRDGNWPLDKYLEKLKDRKVGILKDPRFKDKHVENATVYATLELSYDTIMARRVREGRSFEGRAATVALKVLGLLAFYHYGAFPAVTALSRAAKERAKRNADALVPLRNFLEPPDDDFDQMMRLTADGEWNQQYFGVGVKVLQSFSLVKLDPGRRYISMHVLVHSWARDRMKSDERLRYSLLAKIILGEAVLVSEKWIDMYFTRSLGPHFGVSLERPSSPLLSEDYTAELLLKYGFYYQLDKKFSDAETAFLKCLRIWRCEYGNHDWNAIFVLQRLGALYHEMGRLGDAELTYLEVVVRMRQRMNDHDCDVDMLDYQDDSDPDLMFLFMRDRIQQAKIGTKPPPHPDDRDELDGRLDLAHADLARVYMDQGRFAMGKRMLIQVMNYLEEKHGIDELHPEFLRIQHETKALTEPGNMTFWNKRLNDMLDIVETEGEDFWETIAGFDLMVAHANCALKNGMWPVADKTYRAALHLFQRIHGPYDKKVLEILRRMVDCMVEGDRGDEAIEIARDCVRRAKELHGPFHRETVLALEKQFEAVFFRGLEHTDEGVEILREALFGAERCLGLTHPATMRIQKWLKSAISTLKQPTGTSPVGATEYWSHISAWKQGKAHLDDLKATVGPNHIFTKRFAHIVGTGPAVTVEEYVRRLHACFGPHNSLTEEWQSKLDKKRADLARYTEGLGGASARRAVGHGLLVDLCICGEPAHAEGSREREYSGSDTPHSEGYGETEETDAGTAMQTMDPEAPQLGEADPDREIEKDFGYRFANTVTELKNKPIYMCGYYTGRI